jgi:photosystem II stability/assembly factor-like uncharacterized protein
MRTGFIILSLFIHIHVFSQPWMHSTFLSQPVEEAKYSDIVNAFEAWWGDRPYEKGSGFMPFRRWEHLNYYRCYPDGKLPEPGKFWESHQNILHEYNTIKHIHDKTDLSNWTPLGLTAWVNGNSGYNPGNGRINAVTVAPDNPQVIYVATPSGGVWKTNNGGQSWNTTFDHMPHLGVSAIAIHPDSSHIVFAGTGDRDAYDTKATGIYKSTDAGSTWSPSGMNVINWNSINKILFNPQNPSTLFAAANNGIHRSYDNGQSWHSVYSGSRVTDLQFHPADTNILYGSGRYFIRSGDGGSTFAQNFNVPNDTTRLEIAVTQANPAYVYILATNGNSRYGGTYRSTDSGLTFSLMSDSPNYLGYSMDADDDSGQGWYDLAIAASPLNADEIYIGGINVWKSTNGGLTFSIISHWIYDDPSFYTHADIHYLGFHANRLYCGSDGGVFYTDDFGLNWVDISEGLGISQIYRLASSPVNANFILIGTQDNGSNKLQNGIWTHVMGADGMQPMTHPANTNIFYVSYQYGGLMKTTDNGFNVENVSPEDISGAWVTPFCMHPSDSDILYAGYNDIYMSPDAGGSWYNLTNGLFGNNTVKHMKISHADPDYIYASRGAYLYISTDGGLNWSSKHCGFSGSVAGIALSYTDPEKLWLIASGNEGDRIFFSDDAYQTYTNITGTLTSVGIRAIVHQKNSHDALFVGTENAVFYRDTTMSQWIPYMNGLPNVIVSDLEINYSNNMLRAGTYGRGVWETPIPVTQGTEDYPVYNQLKVYPNPASTFITVDLSDILNIQSLIIFDITGKVILEMNSPAVITEIDVSSYVSGIYFLKVLTSEKQYIQRLTIHH